MNCRLCDLPLVEGTSSYDAGRHSSVWDCKRALMDTVRVLTELVERLEVQTASQGAIIRDYKERERTLYGQIERLEAVARAAENMEAVYRMPISDPLRQALAALNDAGQDQGQERKGKGAGDE